MLCRWKPSTQIAVIVAIVAATGVSSNQHEPHTPIVAIEETAQ
ncbi:hypothetical protein [Terricaulis silvestris]|uniref:Uncharacterized protein n=1 Tax=Terricaulis silvestris TaxID=2686094 RepID=A0A6I6MM63_9CAUL|nr:hypothetical protein [Terricaulis silvestris]QGZ95769.1 hypothetical protein DSM104635_02620 [Terricaulis silvestris]